MDREANGNRLGRHRLNLIRRHVAAFTTLTEHLARQAREIGVRRVVEVPNGIDPEHLHPPGEGEKAAARAASGLDGDSSVVLFVGRLVELKGLHDLLEAWSRLEPSPAQTLVLVGGGPEEVRLRALARDLGLAAVVFVGSVADVRPYYWSADVFVLPSHEEGMPVALLEALSCGLPCVVSDLPTIRSVIDHGQSGLLFPARDTGALREALSGLLAAEAERTRLGESARRIVQQRYSLAAVTDQHVSLYASLDSVWAEV